MKAKQFKPKTRYKVEFTEYRSPIIRNLLPTRWNRFKCWVGIHVWCVDVKRVTWEKCGSLCARCGKLK